MIACRTAPLGPDPTSISFGTIWRSQRQGCPVTGWTGAAPLARPRQTTRYASHSLWPVLLRKVHPAGLWLDQGQVRKRPLPGLETGNLKRTNIFQRKPDELTDVPVAFHESTRRRSVTARLPFIRHHLQRPLHPCPDRA